MEMEKEKGGAKETGRGTPAVNGHISKTKKKTTKKKTTSRSAKDGPTDCPLCSVETKSLRSITMHLASSKHLSRVRAALGLSAPAPVPALVPVSAPAAALAPNYSYAAHTTAYPSSINLYAYPSPLPLSKAPFLRTSLPPMARPRARQTQADRISAGLAKLFALRGSKKLHTTQLGYNNIKAVISDVSCSTTQSNNNRVLFSPFARYVCSLFLSLSLSLSTSNCMSRCYHPTNPTNKHAQGQNNTGASQ